MSRDDAEQNVSMSYLVSDFSRTVGGPPTADFVHRIADLSRCSVLIQSRYEHVKSAL